MVHTLQTNSHTMTISEDNGVQRPGRRRRAPSSVRSTAEERAAKRTEQTVQHAPQEIDCLKKDMDMQRKDMQTLKEQMEMLVNLLNQQKQSIPSSAVVPIPQTTELPSLSQ